MPLLDHFHPPLKLRRHWSAFHNAWATFLAGDLNHRLPPRYFAEANVKIGIEIDVAGFEFAATTQPTGGVATVAKPITWTPPPPVRSIPFTTIGDVVEVAIYDTSGGPTLAAAVELVSPANKDRPAERDAFVAKCASYLQQGIGLVIVDIVTELHASLHDHLLDRLIGLATPSPAFLYTSAYHAVERNEDAQLDVWHNPLTIGQHLPVMPLWVRGGFCVPLQLEATYAHTCQEYRIGAEDAGSAAG
jgi:hypothetical protein